MAWQTPTVDDVMSEFTTSELATISTLMGNSPLNWTTILSQIITRTIAEIRDYIASGRTHTVEHGSTPLPDSTSLR